MRFTGAETTKALVERVVARAGSGYYDTMADDQMRRRRQAAIAKDTATARRIRRLFRADYNTGRCIRSPRATTRAPERNPRSDARRQRTLIEMWREAPPSAGGRDDSDDDAIYSAGAAEGTDEGGADAAAGAPATEAETELEAMKRQKPQKQEGPTYQAWRTRYIPMLVDEVHKHGRYLEAAELLAYELTQDADSDVAGHAEEVMQWLDDKWEALEWNDETATTFDKLINHRDSGADLEEAYGPANERRTDVELVSTWMALRQHEGELEQLLRGAARAHGFTTNLPAAGSQTQARSVVEECISFGNKKRTTAMAPACDTDSDSDEGSPTCAAGRGSNDDGSSSSGGSVGDDYVSDDDRGSDGSPTYATGHGNSDDGSSSSGGDVDDDYVSDDCSSESTYDDSQQDDLQQLPSMHEMIHLAEVQDRHLQTILELVREPGKGYGLRWKTDMPKDTLVGAYYGVGSVGAPDDGPKNKLMHCGWSENIVVDAAAHTTAVVRAATGGRGTGHLLSMVNSPAAGEAANMAIDADAGRVGDFPHIFTSAEVKAGDLALMDYGGDTDTINAVTATTAGNVAGQTGSSSDDDDIYGPAAQLCTEAGGTNGVAAENVSNGDDDTYSTDAHALVCTNAGTSAATAIDVDRC